MNTLTYFLIFSNLFLVLAIVLSRAPINTVELGPDDSSSEDTDSRFKGAHSLFMPSRDMD